MAHSIQMTSTDNQIRLLSETEKHEIEEGRKGNNLIDIKDTNSQDPLGSETKKSVNQIFDEEFKDLENSSVKSCTIFKVNAWLRESNPAAYTPKMVSIGPYHNKKSQLDPMKKYKLLYLRRFLKRKQGLDVASCINELEKQKEEAIKCYEDIEDLDIDEFCQILLLDGCFVVEFIREHCGLRPIGEDKIIDINNYDHIFRDLMLLENQLPFFVLDKLHHMTKRDDELPLAILMGISFPFFVDLPKMTLESFIETGGCGNIKHLLHLVHILSCHGNRIKRSENKDDLTWHMIVPNVTELSEAGVRFAKSSDTSPFDIKFENGLMTIPCFRVDNDLETNLLNLIAYEQQSCDVNFKFFNDFVIFMDYLMDSDKDVIFLRRKGIIVNWLGEDKEVVNLFNKIGSGITMGPKFYYKKEFAKAVEYWGNPRSRMRAAFIHNFFKKPLAKVSTVAAIIVFIFEAIQTILAFTGPLHK